MGFCVNTRSKEFRRMARRLNMSEASLENVIHEYMNAEGNGEFPSDSIVLTKIAPAPIEVASMKLYNLWRKSYSSPIRVETFKEAQAIQAEAARYFPPESIAIKELHSGKYEVNVAKFSVDALRKITGTPLKEQYKGKLIFAQSGTGKSAIADNINVIDSDVLFAEELGTSPQSAMFVYNNLDEHQRKDVAYRYRERIRAEIAKGKTVLTANSSMMREADVVVYNESAELTASRTSAADREGYNKYVNFEKFNEDLAKINELRETSDKEFIPLKEGEFLGTKLLTDTEYRNPVEVEKADTLTEAVDSFLEKFGMTRRDISGYKGKMPLFSAIDRAINARSPKDITDGVGYAIAYMLQEEPVFQRIVIQEAFEQMFPGTSALLTDEFIDNVINGSKEKSIKIPFGLAKLVGRKYVTPGEVFRHLGAKDAALKSIGNDIAKTLREYYEGKDVQSFPKRIWEAIKQFIRKITNTPFYEERLKMINELSDAIIRKDASMVQGARYKPGNSQRAELLNLSEAFEQNPFESDIIKKLSDAGIAIAGSTSIRVQGTIYRPSNNPLHDIDFEASHIKTKEELTEIISKLFPNIEHVRTIKDRVDRNLSTETYLMVDRPFKISDEIYKDEHDQTYRIITDANTGENLGSMYLNQQEVELNDGVKAKLLDFFIDGKGRGSTYGTQSVTINGEEYLASRAENAFKAKTTWQRRKDLFDYRFYRDFNYKGPTGESASPIEQEMSDIREKAIREGNFMKAPNGKPTHLTERQWLQVRTKAFKEWFGDWEKQYTVFQGRQAERSDGRKYNYYTASESEAKRYGPNVTRELISTEGYLQVIKNGRYSDEFLALKEEFKELTGETFDILDNSDKGLQTQSDFFSFLESKGYVGVDYLTENPGLHTEDVENPYLVTFDNSGKNGVSKVVDENGEPLVVYHHSDNASLVEFSTDFENYFARDGGTREAIFFDEEKTGTLGRKYDIPVFLNIRDLKEYNETKAQLHERGTTYRQVVNESAADNNVDGGVHMKDFDDNKKEHQSIWIVHNPNQIKSATNNSGEFSTTNNNINFNIEGKSLKEFLRDRGLIHTYDPTMGHIDQKAMYVTKGDGTYSIASKINEIYNTLRIHGISPAAVSFTRTANAVKIEFNSVDAIERSAEKELPEIKKVVDFLQARIPALKGRVNYVTKDAASKVLGREIKANENSFVKDGKVYLVGRRFTTDIAVEECLHPFTATLKYENPFLYNRLAEEAMSTFPKLWEDIVANYSNRDGFTHEDRINELVTQSLARNFREQYKETLPAERKTFMNYVRDFISWFRNLFYRVNPVNGNQIIDLNTIKPDMTLKELAGLINTSDTEFSVGFEEKTRFNKERAKIAPDERAFITETIVLPGMDSETLKQAGTIWDNAIVADIDKQVSVPESEWKALDTNLSLYENGLVVTNTANKPIVNSSLDTLLGVVRYDWFDGDMAEYNRQVGYNKKTRTMYMPNVVYDIAKLIKLFKPIEKDIIRLLNNYGYNTDSHRYDLADALSILVSSEGLSFEDFMIELGGEFYYSDSRQGELFNIDGEPSNTARVQPVRDHLAKFQQEASRMTQGLNTLLESDLMSNAEVKHAAEQVVYFISDSITEFLEDPSRIFATFEDLNTRKGKVLTDKEREEAIEKFKKMSRAELVSFLTPRRLMNFASARLFTINGNPALNNRTVIKKANLIKENFDSIIEFASDYFTSAEDSSVSSIFIKEINKNLDVKENGDPINEDFDRENDIDVILDKGESLQEHWQIENRTIEIMSSMSQLVRQVLNRCFLTKVNERGEIEKIPSEFGIAERVNAKDATSSILRWTRGAESLSHMVEMLEAKVPENPWVKQVVDKLKDNTGAEADFQSQFYGVFAKAFQPYSIVLKERDEKTGEYLYKSIQVNQHPALTEAKQSVEVAYKTNVHPLFDNGKIKLDVLETLSSVVGDLVERVKKPLEENDRAEIITLLSRASDILGYHAEDGLINIALDNNDTFQDMVNNLRKIFNNLNAAKNLENYDPFKFRGEKNIGNFLGDFLSPITEKLEETAVSSFYDSGKMYQSYVTPSYLTVMMNHFGSEDAKFQEFLESEYGQYEWFKDQNGWRNDWLETLDGMSQKERKDLFRHKVQLNFNKHNYMRSMSDTEYALSVLSEYFSEFGSAEGTRIPVWYRIPMMSNKPSSEFIRMYAYTGDMMEYKLTKNFSKIFQQELSRIQTVEIRDYGKKDPNFIKNFDKNGKRFVMLDFFNKYLKGGEKAGEELGYLINKAIEEGTEYDATLKKGLTAEENSRLEKLVSEEITNSMNARAEAIIAEWQQNGIFEGAKQIKNVGKDDATVKEMLREFIWNDAYASMSILELTVTDPAYYKDAEDLQKRLAQIHAPGIRANVEAVDYNGNRVTDGKFRTILLKDFDDFISNIKSNLRIVFDKKLAELERSGVSKDSARYKAEAATYNNIIEQYDHINVADAQGYSSPTSYRKKAFIFGKWSRSSEEIYDKLKRGIYTYSDLKTAFQPLKPFVYGQIEKPSIDPTRSDIARPLSKLKVPVQFKNSEYLLVMADAILQNEDTGMPNILRAIYQVMEESAAKDPTRGLDTIQFESTCKSGLMAPIDVKKFYGMEGGEAAAKTALENAIYNEDGSYNTATYVYEVPFENYAIQQDVPEHFKNHSQAHGSQIRYIIASDLESVDSNGNPVTYDYFDRGVKKQLTAEQFKKEYEENISENIEDSIDKLSETLGIGKYYLSKKDRNIALSKILLEEIRSSPRYGVELAAACTVNDETGEFNIPLGDPIQSKRIEQLINSVVKNRINKQEVAGGPVVQVTNFGTSRELNIRFKDRNGGLLLTRSEFENSGREGSYEDYIKENQGGIAYYEVFAPIFSNELFDKFADKDGNIDIETIEKINPELLEMIGYRIPTEDKYSMAPLKIVGFLPREAGDGIMLPNDITLLTGSDFDVDKFYLMRKEISITHRFLGDMNAATIGDESYMKKNRTTLKKEIIKRLGVSYDEMVLSEEAKGRIKERVEILAEDNEADLQAKKNRRHDVYLYKLEAEERRRDNRIEFLDKVYNKDLAALEEQKSSLSEEEYNKKKDDIESAHSEGIKKAEDFFQKKTEKLEEPSTEITEEERKDLATEKGALEYDLTQEEKKRALNNAVEDFLDNPFTKQTTELGQKIKDVYIKYMFDYVEPTSGTTYRNNKIVNMSWAVLTNETTASKMLNPGGFEPQKSMGYMISAYQNPANNISWEDLNAIAAGTKGLLNGKAVELDPNNDDIETGTDALKSLCYTEKNLCFIDTHLQFYKQNSAAATALGMAAVQKVAHAVLESNGFALDVSGILSLDEGEFFSIAGKTFSDLMEIDNKYNDEGQLIGRTLGEFVAMFADAVKDPVANLMNINNTTMPIITTLIRLGMPFKQAALFISQPVIKNALALYNSENVTNFVSLSDIIERQIEEIKNTFEFEDDSEINELNTLTEEELIRGLREGDAVTNFKVLKFFQNIDKIAKALKSPTYATRFNSISNAVGPLVIDNLIMEYKATRGDFKHFYDRNGKKAGFDTIMRMHPILRSFYKTVGISKDLLDQMPANSDSFRNMLNFADEDLQRALYGDRKTLGELSDFYQSYLLVASGAIPVEATGENKYQGLKYYIEQFPKDFIKGNAKELFKGNALIDAIKVDIQKGKTVLKVDTTGLTTQDKEKLGDGWADLYKSGERGKKLAEHLFYYNFWRTGIGFSPKSFMSLFPTRLKSKIAGYNSTFTIHSGSFAYNTGNGDLILDQFASNNADNNKLVPKVKIGKDGANPKKVSTGTFEFSGKDFDAVRNKYYIKIKSGGSDIVLKRISSNSDARTATYSQLSLLGNNGEYFEASTDRLYTPLAQTVQVKEQKNDGEMQEVPPSQVEPQEVPIDNTPTPKEQLSRATRIRNKILELFMMTGKTKEQAEQKIQEFKSKSKEEKNKFRTPMKKFFADKLTKLGIEYNEKLLDEMFEELC